MAGKRGVRLNPDHDERTRAKIQTSQIINRLTSLVNGKIDMTAQQVSAAKILLGKTLPDLSSVQMDANVNGEVKMTFKTVYEKKPDGV